METFMKLQKRALLHNIFVKEKKHVSVYGFLVVLVDHSFNNVLNNVSIE